MGSRPGRLTMADRVALSTRMRSLRECPARHCWIADPEAESVTKLPGLLVEWRPAAGGGWQGRVVYVKRLNHGRWALVEEWVDEALLTPA
jgi:hypothetical protein